MGTLSKRPLKDFGLNLKEKADGVRHTVSDRLEQLDKQATAKSQSEGRFTRRLEHLTAALPSSTWLALAAASLAGAIGLKIARRNHMALLAGQFAPTFLLVGVYNKLVKIAGSDRRRF